MDDAYDVPDSTDWLETPLKDFASLENALHCQICKEFYDTPMITSCNHTFCSKCIRTSLSADGKCPACRSPDQASKLRNNWAVQEVVATFVAARPAALKVAKSAQDEGGPKRPGKRKRQDVYDTEEAADGEGSARTTRSKSRRIAASQESHPEAIEIEDSEGEEDDYRPDTPPSDGLVECPLQCGKRMKEEEVFVHLDRCEDEKKQRYKKQAQAPANPFGTSRQPQSQDTRPQDRINELNYSMLKDNALTKKLKEAGIPSGGGRQVMINRHREWVNIWNANCDSTRPRTKRELLHDLDVWDRTQGGKAPSAQGLSSTIMRKDFDGDAYSKRHQDDFSRLIADAKRKKSIPAPGDSASKDVEMAMENAGTGQEPSTPQKDHNSKADPPADHDSAMPYADNPRALSAVREKVHDINLGHTGEPATNADFAISHSIPSSSQSRPQKSEQNPPSIFNEMIGTPGQSDFDRSGSASNPPATSQPPVPRLVHHTSRHEHGPYSETCDIPTHLLQPGEAKKLPMFEVPAQPVSDLDGGASSVGI